MATDWAAVGAPSTQDAAELSAASGDWLYAVLWFAAIAALSWCWCNACVGLMALTIYCNADLYYAFTTSVCRQFDCLELVIPVYWRISSSVIWLRYFARARMALVA